MNIFLINIIPIILSVSIIYIIFQNLFEKALELKKFNIIFFYHLAFIFIFLVYTKSNDSDSIKYFIDGSRNIPRDGFFYFGSQFVVVLTSNLINLFKLDYFSLNIVFGSFGTLGLLFLASMVDKKPITNFLSYYFLLILIFLPSLHFFTSTIGKDSLIFLSACILVWCLYDFNNTKIPLLIGSLFLMALTRIYIALPVIFALLFFFPFIIEKKYKNIFYKLYYISVFTLIFLVFIFIKEIFVKAGIITEAEFIFNKIDLNHLWLRTKSSFVATSTANSNYMEMHNNYLFYYFKYTFGPFINEPGSNLKFIFSKIESVIYLSMILTIFFFMGVNFHNKQLLSKNIMFLIIFFSITIPLSLAISNFGISIRQRIVLYPFILFTLVSNFNYFFNEKKTNSNIYKSNHG